MIVYCITNSVNNKKYIGITTKNLVSRKDQHLRLLSNNKHPNHHLQNSFNKYGEINFQFNEVMQAVCIEQLNFYENEIILRYNTIDKKYGYNFTYGGNGIYGYRHTDDAKKRIGISSKQRGGGKIGGNKLKGIKKPREVIEKIRLSNIGKKRSKEACANIGLAKLGKENKALFRKIIASDGRCFESVKQAACAIRAKPDSISAVLTGKRKTIFGLVFSYIENTGG